MARCWSHELRWWFVVVSICGWSFLVTANLSSSFISRRNPRIPSGLEIMIFLREQCDHDSGLLEIHQLINNYSTGAAAISVIPRSQSCDARSWGLGALVQALGQTTTKALIAALDPNICEVAAKLAHLWNKPLLTWTCPQKEAGDKEFTSIVRLSPSLPTIAQALAEIFLRFRWKSVVVIGVDHELWSSLDRSVVGALRSVGIVPRHHAVLPFNSSSKQIHGSLRALHTIPCRAIILCLPLDNDFASDTLVELDTVQASRMPHSVILMVHPGSPEPFLPDRESTETVSKATTQSSNFSTPRQRSASSTELFLPPQNLSRSTLDNLLVIVPIDQRYDIERLFNGTATYVTEKTLDHLKESLDVLTRDNSSLNSFNNKMFTYSLLAWNANSWMPIVNVVEQEDKLLVQEFFRDGLADDLVFDLFCLDPNDCPHGTSYKIPLRTSHIVAIVFGSLLFALTAILTAALIRRYLLKNRMSKRPYKIILTASDFVFPQVPDTRRVDEGIEAMLCCWLQQLQEFGGPEVEKPDLLQGSVGSLKPQLQNSTGNLARHPVFKDPRARYNGDLVQLKEVPCQGSFEIKSKAMDVLVAIHGLRHENLNPLIGCLTEPTRPCLVYEYCSRGSLEDVLVQDEIKLDWSFRLSLLTDLVRGMKYLHSSPIRVHGYLTSRNCVIDARWVLKVTDYGLPAFYEAQNIVPSPKAARDLLWTAPELLRHAGLRKKGTQPGDVYSFGIVMQEVVVRGEPFCMLALSPEDIIEKVKKPPPLIRPSVSKGAAPPEAINIMRQCWAEAADMRPDFNAVHDLFKKLNHGRKVNFVDTMFQMLEKYSNNLEELIRERTEQLDMEKKKTEQLLNRMLPNTVADKLKLGMPVDPEEFREVTIYFSDIVGFTTISAHSTPFQVVDFLNDLYTCFDATINAYTVYKVETIGDAYMVVGGCPVRILDHASQVATMALDLLHQSGKFRLKHLPKTQLRLRIGLHTGPCCAGVVGLTMPRYCLFGDTVNTASRMESTGAPWRIHLSQETRDRLMQVGGYYIEYRGRTDVKGKGKMPTYWLLGKQGFDKELPTPPPLGEDHGLDESLMIRKSEEGELEAESSEQKVGMTEENSSGECSASTSGVQSSPSKQPSLEKTSTRKVAVSVHDDKSLATSHSMRSAEAVEVREPVTKSTSGDTPMSLGTPVSATEVAAALLGSSTSSLTSISSSAFRTRHRRVGIIDEDDLSTPYNHYRCLSPNESYGKNRLLKRQFSLDRADEPSILIPDHNARLTPRLYKQNSAGAANDLERIEEVPTSPKSHQGYRHATSMSLSVESLSLH